MLQPKPLYGIKTPDKEETPDKELVLINLL